MKKLYLSIIALVIFASLLMAQVQSEPSEVVGYVAYDCVTVGTGENVEGNNLIALAMEKEFITAQDIGEYAPPGVIDVVLYWEATSSPQGFVPASYVGGTWFNADWAVEQGYAYMINVTEPLTFYSVGKLLPDVQRDFVYQPASGEGNNLIMVPLSMNELQFPPDLANDIGGAGVVDVVLYWEATSSPQGFVPASYVGGTWFNADWPINIAMPLMVNVTEEVIAWP